MNRPKPVFGFFGLETTHPETWVPPLRERGLPMVAYDEGEVTTPAYQRHFCERYGVALCGSKEEFFERADVVAIMSANFDRHVPVAREALALGKTVFLDKPVAAGDADLAEILTWSGRKVVLGSSNRLDPRLLAWRASSGRVRSLCSSVGSDEPFSYAIHAVEMGQTVLGPGARAVRCVHETPPVTFQVRHDSGACWFIEIMNPSRIFHVALQSDTARETLVIPGGTFHGAMIDEVLRVNAGEAPLISPAEAVEAVRILRAGHASRQQGGAWVDLDGPLAGFSGCEYATQYRKRHETRLTTPGEG
ncbi:MAG TPA: Gfo/Idh/MocA family oxidoreductase [Chthoniobacteraceae bacterium]|nr:Gfo/Idh/MocA family oxidoreductase [Chthoniobacteraceae bacterium]